MIYWSSLESELSDDLSDITPISLEIIHMYRIRNRDNFIVIVSLIIFNIFLSLGDIPSYNKIQMIVRK